MDALHPVLFAREVVTIAETQGREGRRADPGKGPADTGSVGQRSVLTLNSLFLVTSPSAGRRTCLACLASLS